MNYCAVSDDGLKILHYCSMCSGGEMLICLDCHISEDLTDISVK